MKYRNIKIIGFIGIFIVLSVMMAASYAYFTIKVNIEGKDIHLSFNSDDFEVKFNDTSTISMVNAYTKNKITKEFTIKNISNYNTYYDLIFDELINNFEDKTNLVYKIESVDGGININEKVCPSDELSIVGKDISINVGQTHSYKITIEFKQTDDDQSDNMNKTFSTKILIKSSDNLYKHSSLYKQNSIGNKILVDNTILPSNSIENGLYYTNESIQGTTSYYFKGDLSVNNNIILNNMCFKIIRLTEDRGIRIIYNGLATNLTCQNTYEPIETTSFNVNDNYNAYVGLMYGSANSNTYEVEHSNTNTSKILLSLYTWYQNNLSSYSDYLNDSSYCNNRKTSKFTKNSILYSSKGYSNENTGYDSYKRLNVDIDSNASYDCNKNDRFTSLEENGNGKLAHKVGLLTVDEAVFAGVGISTTNDSYLNSNQAYWTMTPAYFEANKAYNYYIENGTILTKEVSQELELRPVVTLNGNLTYVSGDGSLSMPYQITR